MSKKDTVSTPTKIGNISVSNYLVELPVEKTTASVTLITSVKLQLNIDAHVLYDGLETGKHYDWARAGSIVPVDALDAPTLLEKRIKSQSCCSGSDVPVFIKID